MNENKKQVKNFQLKIDLNWTYGVTIDQLKKDIVELEKLKATTIDIDYYEEYGDNFISIQAYSKREETDLEQQERLNILKVQQEMRKKNELEQLKKLQDKYKNNKDE